MIRLNTLPKMPGGVSGPPPHGGGWGVQSPIFSRNQKIITKEACMQNFKSLAQTLWICNPILFSAISVKMYQNRRKQTFFKLKYFKNRTLPQQVLCTKLKLISYTFRNLFPYLGAMCGFWENITYSKNLHLFFGRKITFFHDFRYK